MAIFPLEEWQVEHLRMTAFPVPGQTVRNANWWADATGYPPDESTSNPKQLRAKVVGSFGPGNTLTLAMEPDRIDWLIAPDPEMAFSAEVDFPLLGTIAGATRLIEQIAERWFTSTDLPQLARLAFGTALRHPEPDRDSAYGHLPDYLPVRVAAGTSDFAYQINVPRQSDVVPDLGINRLSKWTSVTLRRLSMSLSQGTPTPLLHNPSFALRVELDINTAPLVDLAPLRRGREFDIFRELVAAAWQLAERGVVNL